MMDIGCIRSCTEVTKVIDCSLHKRFLELKQLMPSEIGCNLMGEWWSGIWMHKELFRLFS